MTSNGNGTVTTWRDIKREYRCGTCNRLWFIAVLIPGTAIEIRCPKCGKMSRVECGQVDNPAAAVVSLSAN